MSSGTQLEKPLCFGRYTAFQLLGRGGMAAVYLARDPLLHRLVAVKVLHAHLFQDRVLRERLFNEARVIASLRSPHIVEIHDLGDQEGNPYIVMEFVDGNNLGRVLERLSQETVPETIAAALLMQAAEGLVQAKRHGIVHRDIKPENMMINVQGYLKLGDFGIAHLGGQDLTVPGNVLGTPTYMSPEQALGRDDLTFQSDMWGLGMVFYRLLSGKRAFQSSSVSALLRKIVEEPHPPLQAQNPAIDGRLTDIVDTLLQKDPEKRGGGPEWLKSELQHFLAVQKMVDPVGEVKRFIDRSLSESGEMRTAREIDMAMVEMAMARQSGVKTWSAVTLPEGAGGTPPSTGTTPWREPPTPRRSSLSGILYGLLAGLGIAIVAVLGTLQVRDDAERGPVESGPEQALENRVARMEKPASPRMERTTGPAPLDSGVAESAKSLESLRLANSRIPSASRPESKPTVKKIARAAKKEQPGRGEPQGTVLVSIVTTPPFAEIIANGQDWGQSPVHQRNVPAGTWRFQVSFGTRSLDTTLRLEPGEKILRLRPPGPR